jgi:hypothetical protein
MSISYDFNVSKQGEEEGCGCDVAVGFLCVGTVCDFLVFEINGCSETVIAVKSVIADGQTANEIRLWLTRFLGKILGR